MQRAVGMAGLQKQLDKVYEWQCKGVEPQSLHLAG